MYISEFTDKVRRFLKRLFPPQLTAYVPGAKLVSGLILYVLASGVGIGGDTVIHGLPVVGDVTVSEAAFAVGVYLYPGKTDEGSQ
jgi:hypothetical protein